MDKKDLGVVAGMATVGIVAAAAASRLLEADVDKAFARMEEDALDSLVLAGDVGTDDARIWVRHPSEGDLAVVVQQGDRRVSALVRCDWPDRADHTTSFALSEAGVQLEPGQLTHVTVTDATGTELGTCRLHTAPDDDGEDVLAIGVVSCHDPFGEDGSLHDDADTFMTSLVETFDDLGVKRLLLMGDQVYTDLPPALSLFDKTFFRRVGPEGRDTLLDCNREEIRALVQQRYRQFWKERSWQRLQASFASATVPDDHEIVDNYGSTADHDTPAFRTLAAGALDAYHDYQTRRTMAVRPDCFDHELCYGRVAIRMLDLRSERVTDDDRTRILSDDQLARTQDFLDRQSDKDVVIIGLSVPILHVSESIIDLAEYLEGDGGDFSDRWNRPKSRPCRDRLLALLHDFQVANPTTRVVVVGGDVHVGACGAIRWDDGARPLLQLATSPVSNAQPFVRQKLAQSAPRQTAQVGVGDAAAAAKLLEPEDVEGQNPYGGLNAGVVEIRRHGTESQVRLRMLGMSDDGCETVALTEWM